MAPLEPHCQHFLNQSYLKRRLRRTVDARIDPDVYAAIEERLHAIFEVQLARIRARYEAELEARRFQGLARYRPVVSVRHLEGP